MPEKKIEITESLAPVVEFLADASAGKDILEKALEVTKACKPEMTEKAKTVISNAMKMLDSVKGEMDPDTWDKLQGTLGFPKKEEAPAEPDPKEEVPKAKLQKAAEDVELEAFAKSAGIELTDATRATAELAHRIVKAKGAADEKRIHDLEVTVRKAEEDRKTEVVRKAMSAYETTVPASVDDLVLIMKALPDGTAQKFGALLAKASAAIKTSAIMVENGSDAGVDTSTSAWAAIEAKANALAEKTKITKAEAVSAVLKAEPKLYEAYEAERAEHK